MKMCGKCLGKCCRNYDTNYKCAHMAAQVYVHECDYCLDGTDPAISVNPSVGLAMNTELETLGRRAVACKHWRWIAGMEAIVPAANNGATGYLYRVTEGTGPINNKVAYPNLADPVTLGGLVYLVREASEKPWLFCTYRQEGFWSVCDLHEHLSGFVDTEAEAWVEALEGLNVG